jgi:hypothetical protein
MFLNNLNYNYRHHHYNANPNNHTNLEYKVFVPDIAYRNIKPTPNTIFLLIDDSSSDDDYDDYEEWSHVKNCARYRSSKQAPKRNRSCSNTRSAQSSARANPSKAKAPVQPALTSTNYNQMGSPVLLKETELLSDYFSESLSNPKIFVQAPTTKVQKPQVVAAQQFRKPKLEPAPAIRQQNDHLRTRMAFQAGFPLVLPSSDAESLETAPPPANRTALTQEFRSAMLPLDMLPKLPANKSNCTALKAASTANIQNANGFESASSQSFENIEHDYHEASGVANSSAYALAPALISSADVEETTEYLASTGVYKNEKSQEPASLMCPVHVDCKTPHDCLELARGVNGSAYFREEQEQAPCLRSILSSSNCRDQTRSVTFKEEPIVHSVACYNSEMNNLSFEGERKDSGVTVDMDDYGSGNYRNFVLAYLKQKDEEFQLAHWLNVAQGNPQMQTPKNVIKSVQLARF